MPPASVHRRVMPVLFVAILGLFIVCGQLFAQGGDQESLHPLKPADTSSPGATLASFIETCEELHLRFGREGRSRQSEKERSILGERALRCLYLADIPESVRETMGTESAARLKEVLDRIELPPVADWPGSTREEGDAEIPVERWTIPDTEIVIAKVAEGPRAGEYLFTSNTVERVAGFYDAVQHLPYQDRSGVTPGLYRYYNSEPGWLLPRLWIQGLPSWAHTRWLGQAIWQWFCMIVTLALSFGLMVLLYVLGTRRARNFRSNALRYVITLAFPIAAMTIPWLAAYFIDQHIRVSGTVMVITSLSLRLMFLFALIVLLLGAGNRIAALVIATPWIKPRGLDAQLTRLICRVGSIVAAAVVFLEGGQRIGIPLTTLVASAGVGGLAVALAAQDTLKNVFGSIMITLDKPYRVGERIVAKGYDGVVEEIGLRSTKIRLLSGHQASIPNEEMARSDIENIGRRPYIKRIATIQMPSYTSVAKVNRALEIIRGELEAHEGMDDELPPRVYLSDLNETSVGIVMIYWYHPPSYWDYLAFSERVNLRIMEQFEAEGITFAKTALTIQLAEQHDAPTAEPNPNQV